MSPATYNQRTRGARSARSPLVSDFYRRSTPVIRARTITLTSMYAPDGAIYSAVPRVAGVRFKSHPARYYIHNFRCKHSPVLGSYPLIQRGPGSACYIKDYDSSPRGHLSITIAGFQVSRSGFQGVVIHSNFLVNDDLFSPFPLRRLDVPDFVLMVRSPTILSEASAENTTSIRKEADEKASIPSKAKHARNFSLGNLLAGTTQVSAGEGAPKPQHKRSQTTSQFTTIGNPAFPIFSPTARVEKAVAGGGDGGGEEKEGWGSRMKRWFGGRNRVEVEEPSGGDAGAGARARPSLEGVALGFGLLDAIQRSRPDLLG